MNSIHDVILSRRTFHSFKPDPIDETILKSVLKLAIYAPNHKLTNPWRFIRVGPKTRTQITQIAVDVKLEKFTLDELAEKRFRKKIGSSPEMILVVQILGTEKRIQEDYAACACAIQNMMLGLWSFEIGSKWSTGGFIKSPALYELLNLDPEKNKFVGAIMIGYGEQPTTPMRSNLDVVFETTD